MSMDKATTKKVAHLARLRMDEAEIDVYSAKLTGILDWIEQLQAVDTDGVEPLSQIHDIPPAQRKDAVNDGDLQSDVLSNAPESMENYFVVPKIVE